MNVNIPRACFVPGWRILGLAFVAVLTASVGDFLAFLIGLAYGFLIGLAYKCAWNDICKTSVIEQMERNVKASILSYYPVPDGAEVEVHRFMFCLEDGITIPHAETISLRTARVLVAKLDNSNAFVRMLREIVRTEPAQYDTLIGRSFTDQLFPIVPSSRRSDREA